MPNDSKRNFSNSLYLCLSRRVVAVAAFTSLGISLAFAQHDCSLIKNASARLACFDAQKSPQVAARNSSEVAGGEFQTSARGALTPLQKLGTRVNVGISYRDYSPALAEADFEINKFLKSQYAETNGEYSDSITNAYLAYSDAGLLWRRAVQLAGKLLNDELIISPEYINKYPELASYSRKGWENNLFINYNKALNVMWSKATMETARAEKILDSLTSPHATVTSSQLSPMSSKNILTGSETARVVQLLTEQGFPIVGNPVRFKQKGNLNFYESRGPKGQVTQVVCESGGACRLRTIND